MEGVEKRKKLNVREAGKRRDIYENGSGNESGETSKKGTREVLHYSSGYSQ